MAAHSLHEFIRQLRRTRTVAEGAHLTDAQLLERFARQRDEAAFEVLVWRHGTMVLHLAMRLAGHSADAEDVFQATFLTLSRKAASIRRGTALASWLYKVAYRIALRVRQSTVQRQGCEQAGIEKAIAPDEHGDEELAALLADEVSRLPERYRAVVVLCYLQGSTTAEAARVLGCPRGTVLSRLAWARQRLRNRLLRRGIAPAAALAAVSFGATASAMPLAVLVAAVVRSALPFAAGGPVVPAVSSQAITLARGALQIMMWNKIKLTVAMLGVLALAGTGAGWLTHGQAEGESAQPRAEKPDTQAAPPARKQEREEKVDPVKQLEGVKLQLAMLDKGMQVQEERLNEEVIETRMRLTDLQDELRSREREWDFEHESVENRLKAYVERINDLEKEMRDIPRKVPNGEKLLRAMAADLQSQKKLQEDERKKIRELTSTRGQFLRPLRVQIVKAEENLRRLRLRQDRQREEYIAQRQTLRARLGRLEEASMHMPPSDRLRDLEHKLDALRREVSELRRALERQNEKSEGKP